MAALLVVSGASLVCGPAITTTPQVDLGLDAEGPTSAAAAVIAGPSKTAATVATVAAVPDPAPFVVPTSPEQWFQPSGGHMGTEGIAMFLAGLALRDNAPLYISETIGRSTGSGNSDHHVSRTDSWAVDVAVRGIQRPTPQTHTAAKRISTALGVPDWPGGDLTMTIQGYRIQVLWLVAGHYNHVHVGVRKI